MNPYDVICDFYDMEHESLISDTTMYGEYAEKFGSPILVVGVGTGRVALSLASAGFKVTGIDTSERMLALARGKIGPSHDVTLLTGDMREMRLDQSFPLILAPLDCFSALQSVEEQLSALERVRRHLAPGGLFVLDLVNPYALPGPERNGLVRRRFEGPYDEGTVAVYDSVDVDLASQSMVMHLTYMVSVGESVTRKSVDVPVRWFYRYELEHLLGGAGLVQIHLYGDYDLSDYSESSGRMIVTAALVEDA